MKVSWGGQRRACAVPTILDDNDEIVGTARERRAFAHPTAPSYIGRYVRTSAGTFTPSLIWPTERMMSSPSSWAKQA